MDEPFTISVFYRGAKVNYEARLVILGYTHKFYVMINGVEVIYEPDEERSYRAILSEAAGTSGIPIEEIRAVGEKIESLR